MTGRRLYDLYCDARLEHFWPKFEDGSTSLDTDELGYDRTPPAWPYLKRSEQKVWNAIASRVKGVRR